MAAEALVAPAGLPCRGKAEGAGVMGASNRAHVQLLPARLTCLPSASM